jgi:hypothetical protein
MNRQNADLVAAALVGLVLVVLAVALSFQIPDSIDSQRSGVGQNVCERFVADRQPLPNWCSR